MNCIPEPFSVVIRVPPYKSSQPGLPLCLHRRHKRPALAVIVEGQDVVEIGQAVVGSKTLGLDAALMIVHRGRQLSQIGQHLPAGVKERVDKEKLCTGEGGGVKSSFRFGHTRF